MNKSKTINLTQNDKSILLHAASVLRRLAVLALLLGAFAVSTSAQNIQFSQGNVGISLDNTLQVSIWSYPGRGASLPVTLAYSSQVWRVGHLQTVNNQSYFQSIAEAIYAEHSTAGWKSSLDLPIIEWPLITDTYYHYGAPYCQPCGSSSTQFRVARVYVHMPDGATHELRQSDQPYSGAVIFTGTFYAVDGSRLRYDSTSQTTGTLFLPNGTRYVLNGSTAQYIDRNGNTLNYNASTRQWTDTLGRQITNPLPSSPQVQDYTYLPPGFTVPYIFRWKRLADVLTPDANNQIPALQVAGSQYLPFPNNAPTNIFGNNFPQNNSSPSLFHQDVDDEDEAGMYTLVVGRGQSQSQLFNPIVLAEIVLPNGLSYKFSYNIYGEIDKIVYPTGAFEKTIYAEIPPIGGVKRPYRQGNRGITSRKLSANGLGTDIAEWTYSVPGNGLVVMTAPDETGAPAGTRTESVRALFGAPEHVGAHGVISHFWPFGFQDSRLGVVIEERTFASAAQGGAMLRRTLTQFDQTSNIVQPSIPLLDNTTKTAYRNPRPIKTVSLMLDTGGNALAKTLNYEYADNGFALSTGLDRTGSIETFFASIDPATGQTGAIASIGAGATFSKAETSYLNDFAYQSRNILGLTASVVLKGMIGGNLQVVTQSNFSYDESAYPLINYGDLGSANYIDPGTTARGNVTTLRRYVNPGLNIYLETHAQFDQCGNQLNSWNERQIQSQTVYSSTYNHAFATQAITSVPDPSGVHGSSVAFSTSTTFDSTTGLPLTKTDENGQTTSLSYSDDQGVADSLKRLRKVTQPDGGWTKSSFGDTLGNLFSLTETRQDATRTVKVYQYADTLGRLSRKFTSEGGNNYIASDIIYDRLGRVSKKSNPYRTTTLNGISDINHTSFWTTSTYDPLGRVADVTLPDASTIQTDYVGVYTTMTDESGKQRRQKTDAFGRIVRVDEPDSSGSLGSVDAPAQPTFYQYSTQGNLIAVSQGLTAAGLNPEDPPSYRQHRYFMYDALGRITYERHAEQATVFPASDPLTGNNSWSRKLIYDETIANVSYLGMLTTVSDARNVQTQFQYDNLNRLSQISYSDGTPTVTNNYDQPHVGYFNKARMTEALTAAVGSIPATAQRYDFDLMGRVASHQQAVGVQTYSTSYAYDLGGALTSETYPSGRAVSNSYDDGGRLLQVSSGVTSYASQYDYASPTGLLKSINLGNGAVENYAYNSRLQIQSLDLTKAGSQIQHYDYQYGIFNTANNTFDQTRNNGQIAQIESYVGGQRTWLQRFAYDSIGHLSSSLEVRGDNGQLSYLLNYDYDAFGNRYQKQAQNGGNPFPQSWVESGQIDLTNNRFNSGVTYDNAGNITVDSRFRNLQFQYDANNRQKQSANLDGSGAVVSVFDGKGQRVATQVGGTLTNVLVYDASGKLLAEYNPTPVNNGTQYVFSDYQSTPRTITSKQGAAVSRHDYLPFGEEIGAIGLRASIPGYGGTDGSRPKYAGMENDEATGMSHTLWRQYDSLSGRWTAPDPYGGSMDVNNPQSLNRFTYVENDPVNHVDPTGLMLSDMGVYQTKDPQEAQIAEHTALRSLQMSVNNDWAIRQGGGVSYKGNHAHFGPVVGGLGAALGGEAAPHNDTGTASSFDLSGYIFGFGAGPAAEGNPNAIVFVIWEGQQTWNPIFKYGHVSQITMQDDQSFSWQAGGKWHNKWTQNTPSSEYTNERRKYSAGRGYVIDFGYDLNEKAQKALKDHYGNSIYNPLTNNCTAAFFAAINAIRNDLNSRYGANLPEAKGTYPADVEKYIKTYLMPAVRGQVVFPKR